MQDLPAIAYVSEKGDNDSRQRNVFYDEIEALGEFSALNIIMEEFESRKDFIHRHQQEPDEPHSRWMFHHNLSISDIVMVTMFHAPRPEFIELLGENVDIGVSKEDMFLLRDHGISRANYANQHRN